MKLNTPPERRQASEPQMKDPKFAGSTAAKLYCCKFSYPGILLCKWLSGPVQLQGETPERIEELDRSENRSGKPATFHPSLQDQKPVFEMRALAE